MKEPLEAPLKKTWNTSLTCWRQAQLARLPTEDHLLLLPMCLADRPSHWFHQENKLNGPFETYAELRAALKGRFTPTQVECKTQKVKLPALCHKDDESIFDSNGQFDGLSSQCQFGKLSQGRLCELPAYQTVCCLEHKGPHYTGRSDAGCGVCWCKLEQVWLTCTDCTDNSPLWE